MKKENKFVRPIFTILLVILFLMGLGLYVRFNPGALGQTENIPYSQQVQKDIHQALGITVPQEAVYVEGFHMSGLNPVYIWIWDLERAEGEHGEAAIRRVFALEDLCKEGTTAMNPQHYDPVAKLLAEQGYPFTTKIFFQVGASEIQFRELEDGTVQVALIYKTA